MKQTGYLISAVVLALLLAAQPHAQSSAESAILVEHPWARATPRGAKTGAVYLTLINKGSVADRLLSATTPVAEKVQFHRVTEENGVSRMRDMPAVDLAPGTRVTFRPGEMHIMLVGLNQPLKEGEAIPLTLRFEKRGDVDVTASVAKVGAMQHEDMNTRMHGTDQPMRR